jgi:hypothetical protein
MGKAGHIDEMLSKRVAHGDYLSLRDGNPPPDVINIIVF